MKLVPLNSVVGKCDGVSIIPRDVPKFAKIWEGLKERDVVVAEDKDAISIHLPRNPSEQEQALFKEAQAWVAEVMKPSFLDSSEVDEYARFIADVLSKNTRALLELRNNNSFGHYVIAEDHLWYVQFNPHGETGKMHFRRYIGRRTSIPEYAPIWSDVDMEFKVDYNLKGRLDG
ncbi:hypothetical protein AVT69_gp333 [Pseudomonas phage PhiPA3]|uniref:Uncharacterized protein 335 n=1 Tax=Pseudomonas phage PhiPA3 TaxID=998086 RepID=F8SJH1_BPPA3|nr:hypothetical protein AVT69_gp333 [Pseudomonas phage PhiPA3]AEH03758.1 hypothetical protein [Pseudomonas phage PhiPA3]